MPPFNLRDTLESGQIFRWKYTPSGASVCHGETVFHINEKGEVDGVNKKWADNFLREDQGSITHGHIMVREAIQMCEGLRVLRQDPWECLVTFIVSQNNNQKRIQQNVTALSKAFGRRLDEGFHSFPTPTQLGSEEEIKELGLGYRAPHIAKLKDIDLLWLYNLKDLPYEQAKEELMTIDGVGPKVADCVLLFSLGFDQACPEDTWIKKVFFTYGITRERLGPQAGILQQFLFHYARQHLRETLSTPA